MQNKITAKTIKSLEASLQKYPDNVKLMTSLAEVFLKSDVLGPKTLHILERLSELTPDNPRIHRALSITYLIQQPGELATDLQTLEGIDTHALSESRKRLDALKSQHGTSAHLHKALGDLALFLDDPDSAVACYNEAIGLGYADYASILKSFELAQRSYILPAAALIFFASLYDRANLVENASEIYRQVLAEGNEDEKAADWLIKYLEEIITNEADMDVPPEDKLELIDLYLRREKIPQALHLATTLPLDVLKDFSLVKKIARVLIDMEDYRQAFDYLSRIPLDAETKALINEITLRLERHGELDTAVYLLQFINEHDLVIVEAKEQEDHELKLNTELGLAELHYKNKKWDSALEKYIGILKMGYDDWSGIIKRVDEILASLEKPPLSYLTFLGDSFIEQADYNKAASYFSRAITLYPGHISTQKRLRLVYDNLLSQNPDFAELRIRSGNLFIDMGEVEKAIAEYKIAANYPELIITTNRCLARAFSLSGNYGMALEKYDALRDLTPSDKEEIYHLYEKLSESGMLREALDALRLIHSNDPEFRDVEDLIPGLEQQIRQQGQSLYTDPKMRELIGDHAIGRYKYVSKIGSGGMGVVHKVFDIKNNCVVAMKILREGLSGSSKAIDRFFREARIAATLNHKNIVKIYDYNISNVYGQSFITMGYVEGESLRDIVEKRFSESVDITLAEVAETLYYILQLCDALECTHSKGIIHRDIKPDNIMIDLQRQIKITDFGIVHIEEASFTPTGALIGTPRYMSPEQVHGARVDGRSDIYAVGIIMYELLVGSPPFISGDIAYQQVRVVPTPPREICPVIPEKVNAIILKCLEKKPEDRYQAAPELKTDIDSALREIGGYTPPPPEEQPLSTSTHTDFDFDYNR